MMNPQKNDCLLFHAWLIDPMKNFTHRCVWNRQKQQSGKLGVSSNASGYTY